MACPEFDVHAYTLGTGCWRNIRADDNYGLQFNKSGIEVLSGVFLNGNVHWLASGDLNGTTPRIYCLDLETELFSTFSILSIGYCYKRKCLTVLGDQLCFLGCDSFDGEVVIWLMKEYGDEKSWTREFVIKENCLRSIFPYDIYDVFPNKFIRICKDGDLLLARGHGGKLLCFSTKTNTIRTISVPRSRDSDSVSITISYTPSFLPQLKSFDKESVSSF